VTFNTFLNPSPDGLGHVAIQSQLPADPPIDRPTKNAQDPRPFPYNNCVLYPAFGEPVVGFYDSIHQARLVVINGNLGVVVETIPPGGTAFNPPPIYVIRTVVGVPNPTMPFSGEYVQIILTPGTTWQNPNFTWTTLFMNQTPNPPPVNSAANLNSGGKLDV
jgi:hypothetical protein